MDRQNLRVAFFPDSYVEVNGAAMTCKRLVNFARDNDREMLCIHADTSNYRVTDGSVTHRAFKRSIARFPLDEGLAYDPLFQRHMRKIDREIREFEPDVIHITGLNDVSIAGAFVAYKYQIPMVGSWHTNIHEFAASRLRRMFRFLPTGLNNKLAEVAEFRIMQGCILYYKMPKVILSPNAELVEELGRRTKRPSRIMARGVDAQFFSPTKRTVDDGVLRIGYVGRLRAEKNVKLFVDIEKALIEAGETNFKFLIVGEGNEREYLEKNLTTGEFTGFLEGEALAEAYANMDVFIFPSETDAFGNVAQEANASGMPAIVSGKGGPKFIVRDGETGFVAHDKDDFVRYTLKLVRDPELLATMKKAARESAMSRSWESIFETVYDAYLESIEIADGQKAGNTAKSKAPSASAKSDSATAG